MKINFRQTTPFLVLMALTASSCSSNSDSEPEPLPAFFNLNVGNEWVYKEYKNSYDNLDEYNFTGKIDSVEVLSIVNIEGIEFSKLRHKIGNATETMNPQYNYEYLRVDEFGHLVGSNPNGFLYEDPTTAGQLNIMRHPGDDTTYQNTVVQESGTYFASVYPNTNIIVEGNNYTVSPLVLEYTSPEGTMPIINKSVESDYQRQIGLVKKTNAYVSSPVYWENRLVSYHIVN
ncbi:hypothetical protein [Flavobacterium sp.]|uniref:hypothetical protein n=1 Tax=Flavobacterium sp. TaxID=239 RepID=UPI002620E62E|nr:hypothetical protein [Flavobacterium sp.]